MREAAGALAEEEIAVRPEARRGEAGQEAELGLPGAATIDVDMQATGMRSGRGQEIGDALVDMEAVAARIEDGLVLDDDDVGPDGAACRDRRRQRQRRVADIEHAQPARRPPAGDIGQRGHEEGEETGSGRDVAAPALGAAGRIEGREEERDAEGEEGGALGEGQRRAGRQRHGSERGDGEQHGGRDRQRGRGAILLQHEGDGASEGEREIGDGELHAAVMMLDARGAGDRDAENDRQQGGAGEIAEEEQEQPDQRCIAGKAHRDAAGLPLRRRHEGEAGQEDRDAGHASLALKSLALKGECSSRKACSATTASRSRRR